jgi:cytochrome P450
VHSVIRRVTGDVTLEVGTIPGGTLLNVPFVHLLRDPLYFPAPDRYDPDRWQERPRPGTIETAMFGGGAHFCLGYHIAISEGTLFNLHLARAMRRRGVMLRPSEPGPLPAPIYLPLSHPPHGLSVQCA